MIDLSRTNKTPSRVPEMAEHDDLLEAKKSGAACASTLFVPGQEPSPQS